MEFVQFLSTIASVCDTHPNLALEITRNMCNRTTRSIRYISEWIGECDPQSQEQQRYTQHLAMLIDELNDALLTLAHRNSPAHRAITAQLRRVRYAVAICIIHA